MQYKWLGIAIGVITTACTVHPAPENVTSLSTYHIVRQIRCETREEVIQSILTYLTDEGNLRGKTPDGRPKVDAHSNEIGRNFKQAYEKDRAAMDRFDPTKLSGFASEVITILWNTGIAYNYNLEMVEKNNFDPGINLLRAFSKSTEAVGLSWNLDLQRTNTRSFTITDTLGLLVQKVPAAYCNGYVAEANIVYPIAGKIGMEGVIHDFLALTLFGNLAGKSDDVTVNKGPPTMVDQLEFATTVGGAVNPKVTFTPVGKFLHVADSSATLSGSRVDTHKLTVGLFLGDAGVTGLNQVRSELFRGTLITASGGPTERGAAIAVEQFLTQQLFQPKITVQP
jgi:hypothetical protein